MKIICPKSDLLHGVNIVSKAVPSRTTMAILECILIDASDASTKDEIKLTANDMELGIETRIEGTIVERGSIALDAKIFSEIVRKLPDNDVTIETDESFKTIITCEKAKFNIIGKSGEDFSYLPYIERNQPIILSQFTLKEVIRQTIFSISDSDSNKLMTGELFEIKENELKVVSLDGHRISIRNIELKEVYEDHKVVVPGKTLQEVSKILPGDSNELVEMFFTDNHIVFEFDRTTVVSRLIEGEYFKIEQMLSSDYETKIKINKRELLDCIDRATLLVKEGDKKPIIMNVTEENMELKINSFIGSMNEDIDIQKEGKDIMIGFNPKFFIDALRVIDEEEVVLYMVNPKAPCFIKDDDEKFIYLILPVNFNAATN
ncbi:DNA polymerase III subunit beta [Lachnospiraceae bacterium 45-W7]